MRINAKKLQDWAREISADFVVRQTVAPRKWLRERPNDCVIVARTWSVLKRFAIRVHPCERIVALRARGSGIAVAICIDTRKDQARVIEWLRNLLPELQRLAIAPRSNRKTMRKAGTVTVPVANAWGNLSPDEPDIPFPDSELKRSVARLREVNRSKPVACQDAKRKKKSKPKKAKRFRPQTWLDKVRSGRVDNADCQSELRRKGAGWWHGGE